MTPKQKAILDYLREYSEAQGYAPTYREIADRHQLSSRSAARRYIVALEQDGHIERDIARWRGIRVRAA